MPSKLKPTKAESIRVGSVSLRLYPWVNSAGREYWRFLWHDPVTGDRRYTTRSTRKAAFDAARDKAREIHNGRTELSRLSPETSRLVAAFLRLDPTWADLERFAAMQSRRSVPIEQAREEFLAVKESNKGRSDQNVKTLKSHTRKLAEHFAARTIDSIGVACLDQWLSSLELEPRSRANIRAANVTLFRWARKVGYLPDTTTAAEKMEKPIVRRSMPATYTPAEIGLMLAHVRPDYAPWLILAGFAGVRYDELYPLKGSRKRALRWEDFQWDRQLLINPLSPPLRSNRRPLRGPSPKSKFLAAPSTSPRPRNGSRSWLARRPFPRRPRKVGFEYR